jgi:uncharacterized membrane protein
MSQLSPRKVALADIGTWLRCGWALFRQTAKTSLAYAALFWVGAALIFPSVILLGFTPMATPFAGAFMLIAPVFLCGFFSIADRAEAGEIPRIGAVLDGFRSSPPRLWVLALVCAFLFLVWVTDAATVYTMYFGTTPTFFLVAFLQALFREWSLVSFLLFTSVMGAVLAFIIYAISAFAVPLLFYRRTDLAGAIGASVRGVFVNFPAMMAWALLLAAAIFVSLLLFLPTFVVAFPVLAYAGREAYRMVYPD